MPLYRPTACDTYNKARMTGLSAKNIRSAFRTIGNWFISRIKALSYPEIQQNKNNAIPERELASEVEYNLEVTPKTSR
jgi:Fe-S-cluster containining protein